MEDNIRIGAIWSIIAECMLGFGDKALELYKIINPIEHSKTKDTANKYKVEPYVISADVYSNKNLTGRGGWTWYTGSSSWFYKAGIEYILGLKKRGNKLFFNPCISKEWKEFKVRYKYKNSIYDIIVKNSEGLENSQKQEIFINNKKIETNFINLIDDGKRYEVLVILK